MTGVFAQQWVAKLDGQIIPGGIIDGNYKQLGFQLIAILATSVWSFFVTLLILYAIRAVPLLQLLADDGLYGIDDSDQLEEEEAHEFIKLTTNTSQL